ncbi:protein ALP1-like [Corylus avellana]|uniref:protein ALP1-like n=1 Tax=Corylus avellana TaxID=13451 RepID=UPI00286A8C1B|nr:protein ALP1-like [Corylus avellana]
MDNSDYSTKDDTSDSDYGEEKNENDVFILAAAAVEFVENYYMPYITKEPCRTSSQTGYKWVMEILQGNPDRCKQNFRMEIHVFIYLCKELKERYHLRDTRKLTVEELVAMFFITLGHGFGNRIVQERFQHSGETISRHFTSVLMAVSRMAIDIINPIDREFRDVPSKICDDERYWPYFKNCIGAIDGTHVLVKISPSKQIPYIGRKWTPTQNVMAVCDFRMCFTFVWAGWEGTAHDTRIFLEAIRKDELRFPHPPRGKYYLVDAGYPHMKGYMGPYKGERYHLPDFRRGSQQRVKIVVASMALHNFIRKHAIKDAEFQPYDDDGDLLPTDIIGDDEAHDESSIQQSQTSNENSMNIERDHIANLLMTR